MNHHRVAINFIRQLIDFVLWMGFGVFFPVGDLVPASDKYNFINNESMITNAKHRMPNEAIK